MEIIKSIDWAIDTIRNQIKFGLTDNPLASAKRREARAKGVLLDCKREIQSLKDQLAQSKKDLEKAEKVIESISDECYSCNQGVSCSGITVDVIEEKARQYFQEKQDQLKESE